MWQPASLWESGEGTSWEGAPSAASCGPLSLVDGQSVHTEGSLFFVRGSPCY